MRARGALFLVAIGACYDAPAGEAPCSITCTTDCPGDLTCTNGFCVAEGDACAPGFVTVTTGAGFACALDEIGDAWCWGANDHHQVDPGDQPSFSVAHRLGVRRYEMLSAGRSHICGISEGRMFCWGGNDFGQISGSILDEDVPSPTEIQVTGGPRSWRFVSAGFSTTCAIADDGRLFCWGTNGSGELGNGNTTPSGVPIPVKTTIEDWTFVTTNGMQNGIHTTCAISASSGLFCWGSNVYGQLATDPSIGNTTEPLAVALLDPPTSVAVGTYSTCATTTAGELYCWGYAELGQLGDPTVIVPNDPVNRYRYTPTLGSSLAAWTSVSMNELLACGVRNGGEVWCWGLSRTGNGLGTGVFSPFGPPSFTQVASGATQLSVGFNLYIDNDNRQSDDLETTCFAGAGAIRCWGDNRFGQLGQGGPSESAVPFEIAGARTWATIATGMRHSCGIADGELSCWGSTLRGAINGVVAGTTDEPCAAAVDGCDPGKPFAVGAASGVAVGVDHTCSLRDGVIACWGDDGFGQLGAPALPSTPNVIAGAWDSIIDLHGVSTCARMAGATHCWGNSRAPSPIAELDTMTTISAGGVVAGGFPGVACFLDNAGQTFCDGDNSRGQFGNGPIAGVCGDLTCTAGECELCPTDCGVCTTCGNGSCDHGETSATCPQDCGSGYTNLGRSYLAVSVGWDPGGQRSQPVCAVTTGGTVECWGNNPGGMITQELAPGTMQPVERVTTPRPIVGLTACTSVAVGTDHACAICGDQISCWGNHARGAVGAGPLQAATVVVPRVAEITLASGDSWAQLTAGVGFTCARTTAGRAYCWGSNQHGALGLGGSASTLPILVRAE